MDQSHTDSPEWLEHAALSLAWTQNPEKKKIRAAAKRVIKQRIGEIVEPAGFSQTESGTAWELKKGFVTRGIYVQASRGGDRCYFNVARENKMLFSNSREVKRLGHFYNIQYDRVGEPGSLFYYDVEQFPHYVDQAMKVIEKQVLPWLLK